MEVSHFELLVEEPSMEAFLRKLLPRLLPQNRSFEVHPFQGKDDLLEKLESRLRAYAKWLPEDWRIVVVVDRDDDDCLDLKQRLESAAHSAGLRTRSSSGSMPWQLVNRIAVEELEAWYFGDWPSVMQAYPRVANISKKMAFRDSDAVTGGTWEAFERVLQRHGYFKSGLQKTEAARAVGEVIDLERSCSVSFRMFCQALLED
jgi:hypothetical protein